MSDPQPHHLKQRPQRADPWQPDKPGADVDEHGESTADSSGAASSAAANASSGAVAGGPDKSAVSSEARIRRDPQTGQALDDESLTSDDPSGLSDGGSGSARLPES